MHDLIPLALSALELALRLCLPVLGASVAAGAVVSLLQAAMQLHEPAITAVARLLAGGLAMSMSARWVGTELARFAASLWRALGPP